MYMHLIQLYNFIVFFLNHVQCTTFKREEIPLHLFLSLTLSLSRACFMCSYLSQLLFI